MAQSTKRKSESNATTTRKKKSLKQGARKYYSGPDRSGYTSDERKRDNKNVSTEYLRNPFQEAKCQILQKSDGLLQVIGLAEAENSRLSNSKSSKYSTQTKTQISALSSSSFRDGEEIRDSMRNALQVLKQLVVTYRMVNDRPSHIAAPHWMRWERDGMELNCLNQTTRDLSIWLVDCFISPNRLGLVANTATFGDDDDIAKLSWEIMENAMPKNNGDQTWGSCAHEFFKALADILQQTSLGARN